MWLFFFIGSWNHEDGTCWKIMLKRILTRGCCRMNGIMIANTCGFNGHEGNEIAVRNLTCHVPGSSTDCPYGRMICEHKLQTLSLSSYHP